MSCLVEVQTNKGLTGIGEAFGGGTNGEFGVAVKEIIENGYKSVILGEDPTDFRYLWDKMHNYSWFADTGVGMAALSGVDIALVDLAGKAYDVPACKLLGGCYRNKVRPYASHPWMTPKTHEALCKEAAELIEQGFTAIKISFAKFIGFGENLREDIKYVDKIRDAIGWDVDLAISDRGPPRGVPKAISMARKLEEYDLIFWEDALPRGDIEGYLKLTKAVDLPIEAGEEMTNQMLKYFIWRRAVDVVNPDVCQHGGLSERKKIADLAYAAGIPDIPHAFYSVISVAANIQLVASMPDGDLMEYRTSLPDPSINDLLDEPLKFENGYLEVPKGPGLGIELNRKVLESIKWKG
ncbi:MAG: mandelate racemase/muconate lactonizing enzyme family protein [Candidatus Helarchaeota archaeon]|nr:mandelate racemase/muconate lactonizing enzyme family protein [Candidatus Helarchaeota archaeon]